MIPSDTDRLERIPFLNSDYLRQDLLNLQMTEVTVKWLTVVLDLVTLGAGNIT